MPKKRRPRTNPDARVSPRIGDIVNLRTLPGRSGQVAPCRVVKKHPAGVVDVEEINGPGAWRVQGVRWNASKPNPAPVILKISGIGEVIADRADGTLSPRIDLVARKLGLGVKFTDRAPLRQAHELRRDAERVATRTVGAPAHPWAWVDGDGYFIGI